MYLGVKNSKSFFFSCICFFMLPHLLLILPFLSYLVVECLFTLFHTSVCRNINNSLFIILPLCQSAVLDFCKDLFMYCLTSLVHACFYPEWLNITVQVYIVVTEQIACDSTLDETKRN